MDVKQQQGNKNTKWARSLCPLDVEDQRKIFKIMFMTTQSETSPDDKNLLLLLLVHSDTHINVYIVIYIYVHIYIFLCLYIIYIYTHNYI